MGKKEPVLVRYVELTPLGKRALELMDCKHRLELTGIPVLGFHCGRFKLLISLSACAICKELTAEAEKAD